MDVEMVVMKLQAKKCGELLATPRSQKEAKQDSFLQASEEAEA